MYMMYMEGPIQNVEREERRGPLSDPPGTSLLTSYRCKVRWYGLEHYRVVSDDNFLGKNTYGHEISQSVPSGTDFELRCSFYTLSPIDVIRINAILRYWLFGNQHWISRSHLRDIPACRGQNRNVEALRVSAASTTELHCFQYHHPGLAK